ncbi:YSIRK-type signal peptide-containing protein [Flavobacterium sandaracinum]|uniref:YSIRK-type signal peptide-containing protein n=1 Tax=Flavobacterium sandaracinum TaxID=2541733 RepID=A0A4R5CUR9_9FLAO|nr:YSIRK-type signal peptide-containing protein [Flavobacterium sandaracinum]
MEIPFAFISKITSDAFLKVGACSIMVATLFLLSLNVMSFSVVNSKAVKNGLFIKGANIMKASSKV